jgi:hypothetical protein
MYDAFGQGAALVWAAIIQGKDLILMGAKQRYPAVCGFDNPRAARGNVV